MTRKDGNGMYGLVWFDSGEFLYVHRNRRQEKHPGKLAVGCGETEEEATQDMIVEEEGRIPHE